MARVVTDDSHYKAIAEAVRENQVMAIGKVQPKDMAKAITDALRETYDFAFNEGNESGMDDGYSIGFQEGYDDGFVVGEESGLAEGKEQGKQEEYDRFWDAFQDNGNRRNYQYGIAGRGWNDTTFRPKYDIIVTGAPIRMFVNTEIVDLVKILQEQGVVLDTSGANYVQYLFDSCVLLQTAPYIVCNTNATGLFNYCHALKTASIEVNENTVFSNTFHRCDALENLTVVGNIGQNGLNLQDSTKLSKASITSVVNALSASASGKSVTLSKTAVNAAFATTEGGTDGSTSTEWTTLANTKKNWTINLV